MLDFMYKAFRKHRMLVLFGIDLMLVSFSLALSVLIKFDFMFASIRKNIGFYVLLRFTASALASYTAFFLAFSIHRSLWSYIGMREVANIALAAVASTTAISLLIPVLGIDRQFVSIAIIMGLVSLSLMLNVRALYRALKGRFEKRGENSLIVGASDGGYLMLKELEKNKKHDAYIVGFIDDSRVRSIVAGKKVLGCIDEIPGIINKYAIKKVFIAMPNATQKEINHILSSCQKRSVEIKIMKEAELLAQDTDSPHAYPIKPANISDLLGRGELDLDISQISSYLTQKTILVTGAGGSIGTALVKQALKFSPEKIVLLDFYENSVYSLEQEIMQAKIHGLISDRIEICSEIANIRESSVLSRIFNAHSPDVVFHAAAHKHVPLMEHCPAEAIKNNVFGTINAIEASIKSGAERFIFISTDKAVNAANAMGATKRIAEMVMQKYAASSRTKMAAVRFGNVIGSNGSVIPLFEKQIAEGGPITLTHRDVERYFMTIPEAAQLVVQAGSYANKGEIFVLDMGESVKIADLAEKMVRLSGFVPYEDIDIIEIGLRPGEKISEELYLTEEGLCATANPSIFMASPLELAPGTVDEMLRALEAILRSNENSAGISKRIVDIANLVGLSKADNPTMP
ncbi:MAG: polysaccharide biosynthesis protein [Eubacteriaceae bacterium]|nr:polysaccharide biosynthesis protein [Eubacteriaceae bacterium]